jgi:hypothetical protein
MLIEARILRQKLDDSLAIEILIDFASDIGLQMNRIRSNSLVLAIEILIDSASDIGLQMNRIRSNSLVFEFNLKLFRTKLNLN